MIKYFLLLPTILSAQITGVVTDSLSQAPIPFTTVWIENTETAVNADENGRFSINADHDKTLMFSAIGYATKKVSAKAAGNVVLVNVPITLEEISVQNPKRTTTATIGEFKMRNVEMTYGCSGKPFRVARYFKASEMPSETPYLQKISVATVSKIKDAKFNLYLIEANPDGTPGSEMLEIPMLASARKGRNKTEIDVSEFKLKCPENGFFVAMEWLVIPENRYEFTYENKSETVTQIRYEPNFGTEYKTENSSWGFNWKSADWKPFWKDLAKYDEFENKLRMSYPAGSKQLENLLAHAKKIRTYWEEFAVEIVLSN